MIFVIKNPTGVYKINGTIKLQGAKNSMLNNLLLPLLTDEECIFENVPKINDVLTNLRYLESLGANIKWINSSTLRIQCNDISYKNLDAAISFKTTGSKYFIPFMVHRFGEFTTGPSGGDQLGSRAFEDYAESLSLFGISYQKIDDRLYKFLKSKPENYSDHHLKFPSLGLTINSIFASLNSDRDITIHNSCQEAEIDNTIGLINQMGGNVKRGDNGTIFVKCKQKYVGGTFRNMSDRNVAVSYSMLAVITKGSLKIENFDNLKMDAFYKFLSEINCAYTVIKDSLVIDATKINSTPQSIKAYMYPDIHSDWQPLIAPFLTQQEGISYIEEYLFPFRLGYWLELEKLGASYEYDYSNKTRFEKDANPHAVHINGSQELQGAKVKAIDLRAGMALIIASLITKGNTTIENAEEIYRGYDKIDEILTTLGIDIEVIR